MKKMTTLREAREQDKLDQFLAEREASPEPSDGDEDRFNRALASMARTSKEARAASKREHGDMKVEGDFECSIMCALAEQEMATDQPETP